MAKRKRKLQNTKKTFTVKVPAANRNYKDTVFRMLFSNRKNLLSLYNAVNQRDYKNPDDLEIVTLENAIYMGMKNDLAFIIDTNLYLYEHQSTYNPNIPLRDLFYISNEYQKLVDKKSLYSSTLQKIPAPNFIEFYNGSTILSDCTELKLATVYKGNIIKNLIMDCQSYTKYRPNETTGGIFVSWRRKEELPTGA